MAPTQWQMKLEIYYFSIKFAIVYKVKTFETTKRSRDSNT